MKQAMLWENIGNDKIRCLLCPQKCVITEGKKGFCRVRHNNGGVLYAVNYGQVTSYGIDPIEKKPLYHFYPGSDIFSVGTFGCNLRCGFCQNWSIAHGDPDTVTISPEQLATATAAAAAEEHDGHNSIGIAYTYSEPLMWYEYVYDAAKLVRASGLKNVLVTNGFINPEPLKEILPFIDALNIDVKGFSDSYYNETCMGELPPVLQTVEIASAYCHVEVTTLLVNGLNDSKEEISQLAEWLAGINKDIPLHLSRYFPNYKMELPPTPLYVLEEARNEALKKLNYVYLGNVPGSEAASTYCPECGTLLIDRRGYRAVEIGLEGQNCRICGREIMIIR
ncbi:AmmeMemoRadiSam system radical SAM enzyme [Phosphitispora sp. TUW77]|uniref:AmmeMemoRadiSam system radical SAM enzyme n=1 Tax=Phosphitispora sp. TUW77 TaxID=3152361 RepID=UPI003AB49D8F